MDNDFIAVTDLIYLLPTNTYDLRPQDQYKYIPDYSCPPHIGHIQIATPTLFWINFKMFCGYFWWKFANKVRLCEDGEQEKGFTFLKKACHLLHTAECHHTSLIILNPQALHCTPSWRCLGWICRLWERVSSFNTNDGSHSSGWSKCYHSSIALLTSKKIRPHPHDKWSSTGQHLFFRSLSAQFFLFTLYVF